MTDADSFPLLERINAPEELRRLPPAQLEPLARELRACLIRTLGDAGGHFAANLGTVELTIALHYLLATPHDRLVWDVGHQSYPHKVLTGRRTRLGSIRKRGGLAPFPNRTESPYDTFGTGHSSTSVSAAVGMALAARHKGERRKVVAVIGDGGMTAGLAFEALNHAGSLGLDLLVVYNDNDMSISENVGALRDRSAALLRRRDYTRLAPDRSGQRRPWPAEWTFPERRLAPDAHGELAPGAFFESLGFAYAGPVDGHHLPTLMEELRAVLALEGPRVLHVMTVKGKGFEPAERAPIKYHGVGAFDPATGAFKPKPPAGKSYTQVFGDWLCDAAAADERVVGITPAMREGSGLVEFSKRFPHRYFDVAIAEQHAVTLSAGLACEGLRPVVAIYSTFLQRGYDQLIHDVAVQNLPVLFALDRAGIVGADGPTHHGVFDLTYLRCLPNMVVMAPSDENECRRMLCTGLGLDRPSAVRYPRGSGPGATIEGGLDPLPVGKARVRREAQGRHAARVAILAFGAMLAPALEAAQALDASVVDMRFVKPMDVDVILAMAKRHDLLVTVEENMLPGGAGDAVNTVLAAHDHRVATLNLGLPDAFVSHGGREELLADCGLDAAGIQGSIQARLAAIDASTRDRKRSS